MRDLDFYVLESSNFIFSLLWLLIEFNGFRPLSIIPVFASFKLFSAGCLFQTLCACLLLSLVVSHMLIPNFLACLRSVMVSDLMSSF